MSETIDAIIVAAGSGTRLGSSLPKAFVPVQGKPMLFYSLEIFLAHPDIGSVVLVVPQQMLEEAQRLFNHERVIIVAGGEHRWISVSNGVNCSQADWVLVHDAARPFVTDEVINSILLKKSDYECVITVTPEVDTIRRFDQDRAGETIDRSKVVRVGTPQLFRKTALQKGFDAASSWEVPPTDEAMLMQELGIDVGIAWGDPGNFKITTPSDLKIAEALIEKNSAMLMGGD